MTLCSIVVSLFSSGYLAAARLGPPRLTFLAQEWLTDWNLFLVRIAKEIINAGTYTVEAKNIQAIMYFQLTFSKYPWTLKFSEYLDTVPSKSARS